MILRRFWSVFHPTSLFIIPTFSPYSITFAIHSLSVHVYICATYNAMRLSSLNYVFIHSRFQVLNVLSCVPRVLRKISWMDLNVFYSTHCSALVIFKRKLMKFPQLQLNQGFSIFPHIFQIKILFVVTFFILST